jgi:mannose-6-phosphate isomerase-like protein (cupin superfamily)
MKSKQLKFAEGFHIALGNKRAQAAEMVIPPGKSEGDSDNKHRGADQWLYVLSGVGTALINDKPYTLLEGTLMVIEHGDRHEIKNTGDESLRILNFYVPPAYTSEGDELPAGKA